METRVNYALVGAFVLILSTAIVAGVLWIASGRTARKDYDTYLAYFTESVSGLNPRAPVKYRGVEVGSVREISLDPEDPQKVRLVLGIERGVPIKQDTVAVLSVQGLTGIAFVDLGGGSRESPLLTPERKGGFPVIPTRPSLLRRLDTAASTLVADLSQATQSINQLVDADTRAALQRTIRDLDTVVHVIASHSKAIDAGLVDAARTSENSAKASAELPRLVQQIGRAAEAVERAAAEVTRAGTALRTAAEGATGGVQQLDASGLPELQRLIIDARAVASSLGRVAQELERSPNVFVTGRPARAPGPGE